MLPFIVGLAVGGASVLLVSKKDKLKHSKEFLRESKGAAKRAYTSVKKKVGDTKCLARAIKKTCAGDKQAKQL